MKVLFDGDGEIEFLPEHEGGETEGEALNYVKVIIPISGTRERHIKVTTEGVFQEIVATKDGEVLAEDGQLHDDMLGDIFDYLDDPPPDSGRCEHGMFRSGAGACPACGGGAE